VASCVSKNRNRADCVFWMGLNRLLSSRAMSFLPVHIHTVISITMYKDIGLQGFGTKIITPLSDHPNLVE
jgi:hypothetical protein